MAAPYANANIGGRKSTRSVALPEYQLFAHTAFAVCTPRSRSKKEHKTSFKVASASGTEDQAVRLIKNPFPDRTTRVDYYDLVRK